MPLRAQSPAKLLARTRDYDFTSSPDAELKDAFSRLQSGAADDVLPECFAIVAEAIDRRLGVWRLFDDSSPQDASPQDASPQDASPQDASPQDASPQDASPQDASRRTLPRRTLPRRTLPRRTQSARKPVSSPKLSPM